MKKKEKKPKRSVDERSKKISKIGGEKPKKKKKTPNGGERKRKQKEGFPLNGN
jgi:hypothetical protein